MAAKKKAKKKKTVRRAGKSLFKVASMNKSFKAAKKAQLKAAARKKKAWKKAIVIAKRKLKSSRHC